MTKQMEIKFIGCNLQKMAAISKNSIQLDSHSPYNNSNHGTTMQHQRLLDLVVHPEDSILTFVWFHEASPICLGPPFVASGRCLPFVIFLLLDFTFRKFWTKPTIQRTKPDHTMLFLMPKNE